MTYVEKKLTEKVKKVYKKSGSKNQSLDIRRLVLKNSNTNNIGIFKDILLDCPIRNPDKYISLESIATTKLKNIIKKKIKNQHLSPNYSACKTL